MDYVPSRSVVNAYSTAGWFVLGTPFWLAFGYGYTSFFVWIRSKINFLLAWFCLIIVSAMLINYAVRSSLPTQRLAFVIGDKPAQMATIHQLIQNDSFNAGRFTFAVLSDTNGLWDLMLVENSMQPVDILPSMEFSLVLDAENLPEDETLGYGNQYLTCYRDRESNKIYIIHRDRILVQ